MRLLPGRASVILQSARTDVGRIADRLKQFSPLLSCPCGPKPNLPAWFFRRKLHSQTIHNRGNGRTTLNDQ